MDISKVVGDHLLNLGKLDINMSMYRSPFSPYVEVMRFIHDSYMFSDYLPKNLIEAIYNFRNYSNEYGVLLIKGFDVLHHNEKTPRNNIFIPSDGIFQRERIISMVGERLGYLVSYKQEKNGVIFQNVIPSKDHEYHLSSENSKSLLDFHTEMAFHHERPDYILLLCIRPDHAKKAKTFFASTRRIKEFLDNESISILSKKKFKTGIDYSFGSKNGLKGNGRIVSVFDTNNYDYICYDLDLMEGIDEEANLALEKLSEAANLSKCYVILESGDLLIIDNNKSIHGRTEFTPKYDGFDRWLLRACVLEHKISIESVSSKERPRMISRDF